MASVVLSRFGYRKTTVAGSLMAASGLVISAFTPNVPTLYFSYGVLAGIIVNYSYTAAWIIMNS